MFQTKVVGCKKIHFLILSVQHWMASARSEQNHFKFF